MNENLNKIATVFSIFHDGVIVNHNSLTNGIELTVECQYLVELINANFTKFYLRLNDVTLLEFETWMNSAVLKSQLQTTSSDIFKTELEILSAEIKEGAVEVCCSQNNHEFNYSGGILKIVAKKITVYCENKKEISIERLCAIGNSYWKNLP